MGPGGSPGDSKSTIKRNALDAEAERLLSLTPEQMMEEARAEGIDPEEEAREADEWLAKFERGEIKPKTEGGRRMVEGRALHREAEGVVPSDDEGIDRKLAAKGIDPKAARERGAAMADALIAKHTGTQPVPPAHEGTAPAAMGAPTDSRPSSARGRWMMGLAAAVALAVGAAVAGPPVMVALRDPQPPPPIEPREIPGPAIPPGVFTSPPPLPPPQIEPNAAALRQDAFAACTQSRWAECLRLLDHAKQTDPAGDHAERVQHYRRLAAAALHR